LPIVVLWLKLKRAEDEVIMFTYVTTVTRRPQSMPRLLAAVAAPQYVKNVPFLNKKTRRTRHEKNNPTAS
jgi:hypothetical protein